MPDLRGRCNNVALSAPGREPRFDLVFDAWWDESEQVLGAMASRAGRAVLDSINRVADESRVLDAIVTERVKMPPPNDGSLRKGFVAIYKRPDVSFEDFDRHWGGPHAAFAERLPGLRGCVQCLSLDVPGYPPRFDSCPIIWFDDIESSRAAARTPVYAEIKADEPNFLLQERLIALTTATRCLTLDGRDARVSAYRGAGMTRLVPIAPKRLACRHRVRLYNILSNKC